MTANPTGDLNTVISSAVLARIEAEVAAALSGSQFINDMVISALKQEYEVQDRNYNRRKTTFLRETVDAAIKTATKAAVERTVKDSTDEIERLVAQHLKKQIPEIAKQLVGNVVEVADKAHGISVTLNYGGRY